MATTKSYNFGSSFKSAINRGTPAATAVSNIANKTGKTETFIWNWLFKNDFVNRKKFAGNWVYWANFNFKAKSSQNNKSFSFQQFINWAIGSGYCTPDQINQLKSQKDFINFFGPFFANQFGWNVSSGWSPTKVKNFGKNTKRTVKSAPKKRANSKKRSSTTSRKSTPKRHAPKRKRTTASKSTTKRRTNTKSTAKRNTTTKSRRSTTSKRRARTKTARSNKFSRQSSRSTTRRAA